MKKTSVLIVVSILMAAMLCLTGCVSSSSDEDTSSNSTSSESSSSESSDDDSSDDSSIENYTDSEVGFTVSLPSYWTQDDPQDVSDDSRLRMVFDYFDGKDAGNIYCTAYPGSDDVSFSDLTKEDVAAIYSVSVDDVSKKKLSSGSYYLFERSNEEDSGDDSHAITYVTIKNGYSIEFMYASPDKDAPKLSDFEDMVDTAEYK